MKKVKVQIYFALYLAAIVTLLAVSRERDIKEAELQRNADSLKRVNQVLISTQGRLSRLKRLIAPTSVTYNLQKDKELSFDIIDSGDQPGMVVDDTRTKKINPEGKFDPNESRLITNSQDGSKMTFRWQPTEKDTGHYQLVVKPVNSTDPADVCQVDIFIVPGDRPGELDKQEFAITPGQPATVLVFPNIPARWNNILTVSGADAQKIHFDDTTMWKIMPKPDTVEARSTYQIYVAGSISEIGTKTYHITAKYGNRKADASFEVRAKPPKKKQNKPYAYVGIPYDFDGKLEGVPESIETDLYVDGKFRGSKSDEYSYTPSLGEEGKSMVFKRKIKGGETGVNDTVTIKPPPPPTVELLGLKRAGDGLYFEAKTWHFKMQVNGVSNTATLVVVGCSEITQNLERTDKPTEVERDGYPGIEQKWKISIAPTPAAKIDIAVCAKDRRATSDVDHRIFEVPPGR